MPLGIMSYVANLAHYPLLINQKRLLSNASSSRGCSSLGTEVIAATRQTGGHARANVPGRRDPSHLASPASMESVIALLRDDNGSLTRMRAPYFRGRKDSRRVYAEPVAKASRPRSRTIRGGARTPQGRCDDGGRMNTYWDHGAEKSVECEWIYHIVGAQPDRKKHEAILLGTPC